MQEKSAYQQDLEAYLDDFQADLLRNSKERERRKAEFKEKRAFNKLPQFTPKIEFWCDHCQIDFVAPAYKQWIQRHFTGTWQSFCPVCDGWVYRHITSKSFDPYYQKSEKARSMRSMNAKDLIQPGEYGFQTLYGDPYYQHYLTYQKRHEELFNKYSSMGLSGKTMEHKAEEEELRDELLEG